MQSGLVALSVSGPRATSRAATGAAIFILAAGLIHLAIVPLHWAHAPAHGSFLALAGLAEIAWGVTYWRQPSASLSRTGAVMVGGLITLYALTRVLPAPFGHGPEEVDALDLACKLAESLGMAALAVLLVSRSDLRAMAPGAWRTVGLLVVAPFIAGWLLYAAASAADSALDGLGAPVAHEHPSHVEPAGAARSAAAAAITQRGSPDLLQLVVAGLPTPLTSGDEIPLAGDLVAEVTLGPGEARHSRSLEVHLHRHAGLPVPVEAATIQATGRMRYMDHGTFRQVAVPSGGGHYRLPLPFAMPGEWQLDLEIATPAAHATVQLYVDVLE